MSYEKRELPIPDYLGRAVRFEQLSGPMLVAIWNAEQWLFYWNENYNCWTSLRKVTEADKRPLYEMEILV